MPELAAPPAKPEMSAFERAFEQAGEVPEVVKEPAAKPEAAKPAKEPPAKKEPDAISPKRAPEASLKKADPVPEKPKEEPAKPPESEIDAIKTPEFKNEEKLKQFEALRAVAKKHEEAARVIPELEKRIAEAEARGKDADALKDRLAKAETENEETKKLARQVNVELDPEFRREFIDGRATRIKRAMEIIEESGGEPKAIETALNLRGKARVEAIIEATGDLPAFQQSRLGKVIEELTDLDERAAAQRTSPEKYLEERQRQQQEQDAKKREELATTMRRAWTLAQADVVRDFPLVKDDDFTEARLFFETDADPVNLARNTILASSVPRLMSYLQAERDYVTEVETKLAERDKELKELYGKAPSLRGGGGAAAGGKKGGFWEAMNPDGEA